MVLTPTRKLKDIVHDGTLVGDARTVIARITREIQSVYDVLTPRKDDGSVAVSNIIQLGDLIVDEALGQLGVEDDVFASHFRGPEYHAFERLAFIHAARAMGLTTSEAAHCYEERLRERRETGGSPDDVWN